MALHDRIHFASRLLTVLFLMDIKLPFSVLVLILRAWVYG